MIIHEEEEEEEEMMLTRYLHVGVEAGGRLKSEEAEKMRLGTRQHDAVLVPHDSKAAYPTP